MSNTCDPWTVACQALLSMGFSGQEYWSGLWFLSPGRSSWLRNQTQVSCTAGSLSTNWAMREAHDQPREHIKKQRHYVAKKCPTSHSYGFSSSHVWMWELDHKESWVLKNWCFWIVVLEKTLRVPWTARRSNQSILKEISLEYSLEELMLKLKL